MHRGKQNQLFRLGPAEPGCFRVLCSEVFCVGGCFRCLKEDPATMSLLQRSLDPEKTLGLVDVLYTAVFDLTRWKDLRQVRRNVSRKANESVLTSLLG